MAADDIAAVIGLGGIQPDGPPVGMVADFALCRVEVCIADRDKKAVLLRLFEDVIDERGGRAASSDDEQILHKDSLSLEDLFGGEGKNYQDAVNARF